MTSGRVETITSDFRSGTLAADVDAADDVLVLDDAADFDGSEGDGTRWLKIGEADPAEYVAVDDAAATVTLAAPAGDDHEAGLPVFVWDPTVPGGGAKVVEYVATVITDRGPVDATIPHGLIPLSGVDYLIGATVTLGEDDNGDPQVSEVLGREPKVDAAVMRVPAIKCVKLTDEPLGDSTWETTPDWFVEQSDRVVYNSFTARFEVGVDGVYDIRCGVTFSSGGGGRRGVRPHYWGVFGDDLGQGREVVVAGDTSGKIGVETSQVRGLLAGMSVSFEAYQDSGGSLDIKGADLFDPPKTDCSIRWVGPL